MAYKGKRSRLKGPWHYCNRCLHKWQIGELEWQRGLLLCPWCYDTGNDGVPLIGQREAMIQAVFDVPTLELQPDPKLTDSTQIDSGMDEELIW